MDFAESVEVVHDEAKGRCVVSRKAFNPGSVVFQEEAFVYSDLDESLDDIDWSKFKVKNRKLRERVINDLVDLPKVESIDTAKNLLKLIEKFQGEIDCGERVLLESLTAFHQEECNSSIQSFRKKYPEFFPKNFKASLIGRLLGILNTNQHELEDIEGSGLFLRAAICEHNCLPNASFSTTSTTIFVTAIRHIAPGDRISIDYSNLYYSATAERKQYLLDHYGFECTCASCLGPDHRRPFCCPHCPLDANSDSFFFPIGLSNSFSPCQQCGTQIGASYAERVINCESSLCENIPSTFSDIDSALSQKLLHRNHHVFFFAYDQIQSQALQFSRFADAIQALEAITSMLSWRFFPLIHHEKALIFDKLAQLYLRVGDLDKSKDSFQKALDMSNLACGAGSKISSSLSRILRDFPVPYQDLPSYYD